MAHDTRFALLASVEHFAAQLQSGHLSKDQAIATRLLLENVRIRWVYLEMQDAAANGRPLKHSLVPATLPPAPIVRSEHAVAPLAEQSPSAYAATLRPLLASLWRLPGSGPEGPGPWQ
jgi:hypothetical protein